jgi:hypothetical protein
MPRSQGVGFRRTRLPSCQPGQRAAQPARWPPLPPQQVTIAVARETARELGGPAAVGRDTERSEGSRGRPEGTDPDALTLRVGGTASVFFGTLLAEKCAWAVPLRASQISPAHAAGSMPVSMRKTRTRESGVQSDMQSGLEMETNGDRGNFVNAA